MSVRTLILCCIMVTALVGCGNIKESFDESFKESYQKNFASSCAESAVKKGFPETDAKTKCNCIAAYLVKNYSSFELMKLSNGESPESQEKLDKAINSCQ